MAAVLLSSSCLHVIATVNGKQKLLENEKSCGRIGLTIIGISCMTSQQCKVTGCTRLALRESKMETTSGWPRWQPQHDTQVQNGCHNMNRQLVHNFVIIEWLLYSNPRVVKSKHGHLLQLKNGYYIMDNPRWLQSNCQNGYVCTMIFIPLDQHGHCMQFSCQDGN